MSFSVNQIFQDYITSLCDDHCIEGFEHTSLREGLILIAFERKKFFMVVLWTSDVNVVLNMVVPRTFSIYEPTYADPMITKDYKSFGELHVSFADPDSFDKVSDWFTNVITKINYEDDTEFQK